MQRPGSFVECPAKRQRMAAGVEAIDAAECSSVSPMQQHLLHQELPQHIREQHAIKQRMAPSTVVVSFSVDTLLSWTGCSQIDAQPKSSLIPAIGQRSRHHSALLGRIHLF